MIRYDFIQIQAIRKEREKAYNKLKEQAKAGNNCRNCSFWNPLKTEPNIGKCRKKMKFLAHYYICDKHSIRKEK